MKLLILALALTASNALHLVNDSPLMTLVEHRSPVFDLPTQNPYDKCVAELKGLIPDIQKLIELIAQHADPAKILIKVLEIAPKVESVVRCFMDPHVSLVFFGIKPKCVIGDLKAALKEIPYILAAIKHHDKHEAQVHIEAMKKILIAIPEHCKDDTL